MVSQKRPPVARVLRKSVYKNNNSNNNNNIGYRTFIKIPAYR